MTADPKWIRVKSPWARTISHDRVFAAGDCAAVAGAVAGFTANAGQLCSAGSRILVQSGLHDAFVDRLKAARIPCCIGSSTHRENILTILGVLRFEGYFADMVTAEDVSHGKPDPEVFLKAAAKMIEDGALSKPLEERYAKWESPEAQRMLRGEPWWTPHVSHLYQMGARRYGHTSVTVIYAAFGGVTLLLTCALSQATLGVALAVTIAAYGVGGALWFSLRRGWRG